MPDVADYRVSADSKKLLYKAKDSWFIVPTTKEIKPGDGKIAADSIEVKVDPRAEWNEVFAEAWRINRDYFYDPGMHGVDWKAARAKYAALLPSVTTRGDLNRIVQWMASELSVGHHRLTSPGRRARRAKGRARWPPRRRLHGRERPLPIQAGVRRVELQPRAARAADRTRRERPCRRVSPRA